MENNNMEIWNRNCTTDPANTKNASLSGMKITSICPQAQRMAATAEFGPFGKGWGVSDEIWTMQEFGETTLCRYNATFWYNGGDVGKVAQFPITGTVKVAYKTQGSANKPGYFKVDEEYAKKVATDALTKGLSFLGFNADIFLGKYDDSKYVEGLKEEKRAEEQEANAEENARLAEQEAIVVEGFVDELSKARNMETLRTIWEDPMCPRDNELVAGAKEARKVKLEKTEGE